VGSTEYVVFSKILSLLLKTLRATCISEFQIFQILERQYGTLNTCYVKPPAGSGAAPHNQVH